MSDTAIPPSAPSVGNGLTPPAPPVAPPNLTPTPVPGMKPADLSATPPPQVANLPSAPSPGLTLGSAGLSFNEPPKAAPMVATPTPPPPTPGPLAPTPVTASPPPPPPQPIPTPVPAPAPSVPVSPPAPAPLAPATAPVSSRFMDNLRSVSATPFQAPATTTAAPAVAPAPISPAITPPPAQSSAPPSSPPLPAASALFQEAPSRSEKMNTAPVAIPREQLGVTPQTTAKTVSGRGSPSNGAAPPATGGNFFSRFAKKPILLIGGVLALLVVVAMGAFTLLNRTAAPTTPAGKTTPAKTTVTLEYWGLWEPLEVMTPLIEEYQKLNSTVKINYTQQKTDQYRQRVQAAIRQGNGPDIFRYHNTWLPMVYADLTVAPAGTVTAADLQQSFYPIVGKTLASTGKVYGVPLMYEGLALIYNKSILEAANAQPPQDWEAVRKLASTLTIRNGSQLERSGIALGTSGNVDNFSDILATMMLQNAADPGNPSTDNAEHALSFYTIFRRVDQVWDETQPNSTVAFANEKVAMIVAPSWRIADIQKLNPNLRIGVSRLPQLPGTTTNWASFWVEGVSKQSAHAEAAWKFLAWLSQPAQIRKLISAETAVRGYGEISPRSDMAVDYQNDPLLKPYLEDAQSAQSWYMASMTHDEGLNDQMIQYYADAVNAAQNGDSRQALTNITPGIQQILSQYQITVQSASK